MLLKENTNFFYQDFLGFALLYRVIESTLLLIAILTLNSLSTH